ncbi:MAG: hypothetical protein HY554_04760, partial [Elusimicrobia bacterium]|nr:hypothetical protein [Elusimicrobiota bacterium]
MDRRRVGQVLGLIGGINLAVATTVLLRPAAEPPSWEEAGLPLRAAFPQRELGPTPGAAPLDRSEPFEPPLPAAAAA